VVAGVQAVPGAWVHGEAGSRDEVRGLAAGQVDRRGRVLVAVDDQGRDLDLLQFGPHVSVGVEPVRFQQDGQGRVHDHPGCPVDQAPRSSGARAEVGPGRLEVRAPFRDVGGHRLVVRLDQHRVNTVRVVRGPAHQRCCRRHQDQAGNTRIAVAGEVADDFLGSERVGDEGDAPQLTMLDHGGQVIGHGVDVVAGGGPVGPAVAAPVVQHAPEPGGRERGDLVIPLIRAQPPGMGEHHRRAAAPLGDEQAGAVGGFDEGHVLVLSVVPAGDNLRRPGTGRPLAILRRGSPAGDYLRGSDDAASAAARHSG
jgi:hypothetical protein